jgi:hypothetical protein
MSGSYIGHDMGFADGQSHERANPTNVLRRPDVRRAWTLAQLMDGMDVREALAVAIILKSPDAPDPLRDPKRLEGFADWLYRLASNIAEQRNAQQSQRDLERMAGRE